MPYLIAAATLLGLALAWAFLLRRVLKHPNRDNDYTPRDSATL